MLVLHRVTAAAVVGHDGQTWQTPVNVVGLPP
jgi:hypothetical protein